MQNDKVRKTKEVYLIPPVSSTQKEAQNEFRQKRVVAYCRVSTKQEEQLNSYETQRAAYIDMINKNPDWTLVKIFADKGITGTSVKRRDGFNKMIRLCKQGNTNGWTARQKCRSAGTYGFINMNEKAGTPSTS